MEQFFIYILSCSDGSFYVGHTDDLEARLSAHAQRHFPQCYTADRLPVKLEYVEEFSSRDDAFVVERQLKGWSRKKKQALIDGDFDRLRVLAKNKKNRTGPSTGSG